MTAHGQGVGVAIGALAVVRQRLEVHLLAQEFTCGSSKRMRQLKRQRKQTESKQGSKEGRQAERKKKKKDDHHTTTTATTTTAAAATTAAATTSTTTASASKATSSSTTAAAVPFSQVSGSQYGSTLVYENVCIRNSPQQFELVALTDHQATAEATTAAGAAASATTTTVHVQRNEVHQKTSCL